VVPALTSIDIEQLSAEGAEHTPPIVTSTVWEPVPETVMVTPAAPLAFTA
jgi:hypothetical protein